MTSTSDIKLLKLLEEIIAVKYLDTELFSGQVFLSRIITFHI